MGSQWTDESAILRDLSLAQGQWVPGGIDAVVAGEKPPSQVVLEETEEHYYQHWTTDGDFSMGPDLSLIKKMLEMVHDNPEAEDSIPAPTAEIEITKINPIALPILKQKSQTKKVQKNKEKLTKPRRARNVAIASILANKERAIAPEIPLKLSKPEDFIKSKDKGKPSTTEAIEAMERKQESVQKVNQWLHMQDMSNMFKKKSSKAANKAQIASKDVPTSPCVNLVSPPPGDDEYIPSSFAEEYYQKCVKRSHMKQLVKENVWDRAEKLMKEIDNRKAEEIRKQQEVDEVLTAALEAAEAELITKEIRQQHEDNSVEQTEIPKLTVFEKIELPKHRHQLTGDCVVCKVLIMNKPIEKPTKDAIQIKEEKNLTESAPSSPEIFDEMTSQCNADIVIGPDELLLGENDSGDNYDAEVFRLVRASFVENLANLDTTDLTHILTKPSSIEELEVFV